MSRPILSLLAGALLSAGCVMPSPNQSLAPQGLQVRVTGPQPAEIQYEGALSYIDADSLKMYARHASRTLTVPLAAISKIEVYRGKKGSAGAAAKLAALGAATGFVAGAFMGGVMGAMYPSSSNSIDWSQAALETGGATAIVGGVIGAGVGATRGNAVWQEVSVRDLREELCRCRIPE